MIKKVTILSLLTIVLIVFLCIIIKQKDPNVSISVNEINENSYASYKKNTIVFQDNNSNYYQVKEDGIYIFSNQSLSFENKVIDINEIILAQYNDGLFVLSDGQSVYIYDSSCNFISKRQTEGKIEDFFTTNDDLYVKCTYADSNVNIIQFKVPNLIFEQKFDVTDLSYFDYIFTENNDCQTIIDRENNNIVAICKNGSYLFGMTPFTFVYNNCVHQLKRNNYTDYEIINSNKTEHFDTPHITSPARNIMLCEDILLILGVQSGKGNESYSSNLSSHQYDVLTIYDMKSNKFESFKTQKGEKIIYADKNKVITYYNNSYITYSTIDFREIAENPTDKIINDKSYIYTVCGEYIWLFDQKSGDFIERISE